MAEAVVSRSSASAAGLGVELDDIQGLLRRGYGKHTEAVFLLLQVRQRDAARAWLAQVEVADARPSDAAVVLQIALSAEGLRQLGMPEDIVAGFAPEFVDGANANRAERLGDVGDSAPARWLWGHCGRVPHVLLLLYALPGKLEGAQRDLEAGLGEAFEVIERLPTRDLNGTEPFGFVDGLSQPQLDWQRERPARDAEQSRYGNVACLGEFVLGYPNEYGRYTDRPLLDPARDGAAELPRAEDDPSRADLGRNGSYLVLRQLHQDVKGLHAWLQRAAGGNATQARRLAEAMVGRTIDGRPLVGSGARATPGSDADDDTLNAFTFDDDPQGLRCPLGAHIRRANPRNADLPAGEPGLLSWLRRTLGFDAGALTLDRVASTRFHRLLRRGRAYVDASGHPQGLHFVCLNASIARQFEFVQSAWIMGTHFDRVLGEGDPLLGHRLTGADGRSSDFFSLPQADAPDARLQGLPRFVGVRGSAYFFLPGRRALRWISTARWAERKGLPTSPNPSRPVPPAQTGSVLLDLISDTSMRLIQLERRIDPWLRPAFDALLRDALARGISALINRQRRDDGLAIAEERELPDEQAWTDSIVQTFRAQMAGLWVPGRFERGGNTKTHGIVRAELVVHDGLPEPLRHGVFAEPGRRWPAWVRFSGPGPYITPDIDDVGFMSISVKLMGVPGPKLMDEERFTQDFFGVSTPTFVTPDVRANAHLQQWSLKNASLFHFVNLRRPHLLDGIMQMLFIKTQSSPFEAPYFSCVPYLHGDGQAMQYSFWPTTQRRTPIPKLPRRPPDDYLRLAMVGALDAGDAALEMRVQLQTDPQRMPIEHAGVLWPEALSPRVPVATLHIPRQRFASQAQLDFARRLSFNPWHCIAEHRPLGNQSRARRRMYHELSQYRHQMSGVPHFEPDGSETFD